MQTSRIAIWAFLLLISACKKEEIQTLDPNLVKQHTIASSFTGSTYPVYVVLPEDYNPLIPYETMYVLDGDDYTPDFQRVYDLVGKTCQENSALSGKQNIIAVCIGPGGQEERFRDLTPVPFMIKSAPSSGGAEHFAQFMEQELIPFIENNYSVATTSHSRTISGHSLGGLFTGYMFSKHPQIFENYITLSPSIYWGDGAVMKYEAENRDSLSQLKRLVFVGCGEYEEGIKIFTREWHYRLTTYYPNVITVYNEVKGTGHVGSAADNIREGIAFFFKNK